MLAQFVHSISIEWICRSLCRDDESVRIPVWQESKMQRGNALGVQGDRAQSNVDFLAFGIGGEYGIHHGADVVTLSGIL